jgi:hypothetical protein
MAHPLYIHYIRRIYSELCLNILILLVHSQKNTSFLSTDMRHLFPIKFWPAHTPYSPNWVDLQRLAVKSGHAPRPGSCPQASKFRVTYHYFSQRSNIIIFKVEKPTHNPKNAISEYKRDIN